MSAPSSLMWRCAGCSSCRPTCSISASSGTTPEWLATTSAGPDAGTWCSPRILTRNQPRYSSRIAGIRIVLVKSGSNPDSASAWYSPASRRRTKPAAAPIRSAQAPAAAAAKSSVRWSSVTSAQARRIAGGRPGAAAGGGGEVFGAVVVGHVCPSPPDRRLPPGRARRRGYFLFLRWTRVLRSSLRCFFLAIRLRRFLITEPNETTLDRRQPSGVPAHARPRRRGTRQTHSVPPRPSSGSACRPGGARLASDHRDEGVPQVLVDRTLRDPERAADPDRLQVTRVHQAIDGP